MSQKEWVDESFSSEGFLKSLTGKGTTSIDYSRINVSDSGELQLVTSDASQDSNSGQIELNGSHYSDDTQGQPDK